MDRYRYTQNHTSKLVSSNVKFLVSGSTITRLNIGELTENNHYTPVTSKGNQSLQFTYFPGTKKLSQRIFVSLNPHKYFLNLAFSFLFRCTKLQLSGNSYTNKISLSAKEQKLLELSQNSTRYNNRHVLVTWEWYLAKCTNQEMQLVNVRPTMLFPHLYWLF